MPPAPGTRHLRLWVRSDFSREDAVRVKTVGIDEVVVYRGLVDLSAGTPILRLVAPPDLGKVIPQTPVLGLRLGSRMQKINGEALWAALKPVLASSTVILDLREIPEGVADFLGEFEEVSGIKIIPLMAGEQLGEPEAQKVMSLLGECIIPLYGSAGPDFRGPGGLRRLPLAKQLAPLAGLGVKIGVGIGLRPLMAPAMKTWGGDLNQLFGDLAEPATARTLNRAFIFRKDCSWGGRKWSAGEKLEGRWMDVARLSSAFRESDHLILPEISGWDLFGFPPEGAAMGLNQDGFLAYLTGRGPAPEILIMPEKSGRSLKIHLINRSPFISAVSKQGHWLEVSLPRGSLIVRGQGSFDSVVLGSLDSGRFKAGISDRVDAVRFFENYIGAGEEISTGTILLPSSRSDFFIHFRVLLSDGQEVKR